MTIKVMLVDDNEDSRVGFSMMLNAEHDITVIAQTSDGVKAIETAAEKRPDVILMDVRMPYLDGIEATRQITALDSSFRVLILTTYDLDAYAFDGLSAGASGFLLKDVTPGQLAAAVRAVHNGDAVVTPRITRRMLEFAHWPQREKTESRGEFSLLTDREFEIARAITEGLTNSEIANRFFISNSTVKAHINRILRKLNARDRVEIVIRGHQAGLTPE